MLLRAQSKGVHVDTSVGVAGVVLVWLDEVKVGSLALGEAVLTVELELGGHNRVLTPAVHVKGGLGKNEGSCIRDTRVLDVRESQVGGVIGVVGAVPVAGLCGVSGTGITEDTVGVDECLGVLGDTLGATKSVDSVGEGVNGVGVVERLGTEHVEEVLAGLEGRAVINCVILLDNPHKLLNGVVEVELDLVGRRTNRLITSELELLNQILVGVLGHLSALISVKEHVINVERGSHEGLVVGVGNLPGTVACSKGRHCPQALINRADVKVDLDLVVLEGDEGKCETWVTAEPELEGHVKGGLGEGIARSTHLAGCGRVARAIDRREGWVGDVGKLGGVTNHLVVTTLLILSQGKLVPDVHPVTVLAIDALTTDFALNLRDHLLTGEVQPAGVHRIVVHLLVDLRKSHLKVGAVGEVTIAGNSAGDATAEIGLTVEGLFDGLHSEVRVTTISHLPESDLGLASQVNILGAVGDELH